MYVLTVTACLISDPTICTTHEIPIHLPVTPIACLTGAPATLARWAETFPDRRIAHWTCVAEPRLLESAGR